MTEPNKEKRKRETRGGKRAGAGRKRIGGPRVTVSYVLEQNVADAVTVESEKYRISKSNVANVVLKAALLPEETSMD